MLILFIGVGDFGQKIIPVLVFIIRPSRCFNRCNSVVTGAVSHGNSMSAVHLFALLPNFYDAVIWSPSFHDKPRPTFYPLIEGTSSYGGYWETLR